MHDDETLNTYLLVEEIKQLLRIEDELMKNGIDIPQKLINKKQFNTNCPFHDDRSPSFTVWTKTQKWKCHAGCGNGDVINLVSKFTNQTNSKTIYNLAIELGITTVTDNERLSSYKQILSDREILKGFIILKDGVLSELYSLEQLFRNAMKQIKTVEEMDINSDLFHFHPNIINWIECITSDDPHTVVETVLYCSEFTGGIDIDEYSY